MLDRNEIGLRREKWGMRLFWGFAVVFATVFVTASGFWHATPEREWLCGLATVVVAAWEKDIDKVQARNVLDGRVEVDLDEHAEDLAPLVPVPAHAPAV